jgi:hypothetical protein
MSTLPPEDLIERHEAFLSCAARDRPLIGGWLGGYFPAQQFPHGTAGWQEGQPLSPQDVTFGSFAADYENLFRLHQDLQDDFVYIGSAYWGIPWLEAILGCPVHAGKSTCWAESCLGCLSDLPRAISCLDDNPWLQCLLRFTQDLVSLAAGRFPVCAPLLRGPADAAGAMRSPMHLVMEFLDDPAGVRRLLEHCTAMRSEVLRRLHQIIPAWHGIHASGGYPSRVWSKRRVAYSQDDFLALLSPALFREFLVPLHQDLCLAAEVNFIHLHSGCLWPVDILLENDLYDVLEINIDHEGAGPPVQEIIAAFQRIQDAGKPLLLWGEISPADHRLLRHRLDPAGLSIQPIISQREELEPWMRSWRL